MAPPIHLCLGIGISKSETNAYAFRDSDAATYAAAVEAADGAPLERAVKAAYDDFFVGIKADAGVSVMSAHPIKAACILAGARTLAGALVPLVGTAPTNNNFVSGDYNRETGLVGNGSTKYLDSNRLNSADGRDNCHLACYATTAGTGYYAASNVLLAGVRGLLPSAGNFRQFVNGSQNDIAGQGGATGFMGISRAASGTYTSRLSGSDIIVTDSTTGNVAQDVYIYCRNSTADAPLAFGNPRLAFYSIGSSLTLSSLDARLVTLMASIAAAIP